jgi:hypothetical protein
MKIVTAALLVAALLAAPATAHADCGDPGQDPCTGPVPTVDQVVGIMQQLTDPNIPAANKGNIVTPGFTPDEAGTIDDHLNSLNSHGYMPFTFVVTDIQPAPANFAGATVVAQANGPHSATLPAPIVLVKQGGRWLVTDDAATIFVNKVWSHYHAVYVPFVPVH